VAVAPVSDWSLPLDPDPLHGVHLFLCLTFSRIWVGCRDPHHRRDVMLVGRTVSIR
jgi:hypothetical protein